MQFFTKETVLIPDWRIIFGTIAVILALMGGTALVSYIFSG